MNVAGASALVTGGASGLGLATVRRLSDAGALVTILDLPTSDGEAIAASLPRAAFAPADITDSEQVAAAVRRAAEQAPLRTVIHAAGRGGPMRLVTKDGQPGDAERYRAVIETNLIGSFTVISQAAAVMVTNELDEGERGVIVMTASTAAYEGQIGQIAYSASKAGIVGMTIVAARDLASRGVRVCTIAPGLMDTPLLAGMRDDIRASLAASVPNPSRLGDPDEYAKLALAIVDNPYLNGETIRLDGAIRMEPR